MRTLPDACVNTCITSPPYWGLRDYGHDGQIGLESTPAAYVARMVEVFREVRRVLRDDGTCWVNLGDSYFGTGKGPTHPTGFHAGGNGTGYPTRGVYSHETLKGKDLCGIPWRVAFALQDDGWYLRQDIIWHKPNPMPESVTDRCTKSHEYIFLLAKQERYHFDSEAMKEPAVTGYNGSKFDDPRDLAIRPTTGRQPRFGGNKYGDSDDPKHATKSGNEYSPTGTRNKRSVWTVSTKPYKGAHFATFPPDLIKPCVLAGCPVGGTVLDPFSGSGTTGAVALKQGRSYIGCELNPEYVKMARARLADVAPLLATEVA